MNTFAYDSLKHEKREFRLVEILPSKLNLKVRCRLLTLSIDDAPPYEALSYTWGGSKASYRIEVNGKRFFVAENLHNALRRFRLRKEARLLWADAISINQADKSELSKQVQIMPDIYRAASHVLVWLGMADKKSRSAMQYLSVIGANFGVEVIEEAILRKIDPFNNLVAVAEVPRLLSRPWFSRVWIIQEIAMSRMVTVYCGNESIPWSTLVAAIKVFSCWDQFGRPIHKNQPANTSRGMHIIRAATQYMVATTRNVNNLDAFKMFQERPKPFNPHIPRLEDVFAQMRERGTSDPRDRIFATTSLLPFDDPGTLEVDYTLTERKIYEKATLLIFQQGSLRFLQYCQPHVKCPDLPSWVPDWSEPRFTPPLQEGMFTNYYRRYNASARKTPKCHCMVKDDGSLLFLVATGKVVGTVATITSNYDLKYATSLHWENAALHCALDQIELDNIEVTLPDVNSEFEELPEVNEPSNHSLLREHDMKKSRYKSGCSLWEAYIRTLIADRTSSEEKSGSILVVLEIMRKVKRYRNSHFSWSPYLMSRLPESVMRKALITTKTKYIGLGPEYTQEGDFIVILYGMEVPLVLRKAKNRDMYTIIGEAYIHGVMEGELFKPGSELEEQDKGNEVFKIY